MIGVFTVLPGSQGLKVLVASQIRSCVGFRIYEARQNDWLTASGFGVLIWERENLPGHGCGSSGTGQATEATPSLMPQTLNPKPEFPKP